MLSRRGLLFGLGASLFVAPMIVKASSLMPINSLLVPRHRKFVGELDLNTRVVHWKDGDKYISWIDAQSPAYDNSPTPTSFPLERKPDYYELVDKIIDPKKAKLYKIEGRIYVDPECKHTTISYMSKEDAHNAAIREFWQRYPLL